MGYFCPVCGNVLKYDFNECLVICPCCGNQGNVDDDIIKIHLIIQDEDHYYDVLAKLKKLIDNNEDVPKEIYEYISSMRYTKEEVWKMYRDVWAKKGYLWNGSRSKPVNWNKEMAKRQLENIDIFI